MSSLRMLSYITSLPFFKVLRTLVNCVHPRHLREISRITGLSAAGVTDILGRLEELHLLEKRKDKNRICYKLKIDHSEMTILSQIFEADERGRIAVRAKSFSKIASKRLKWMDQANSFFKQNRKLNGAARNS